MTLPLSIASLFVTWFDSVLRAKATLGEHRPKRRRAAALQGVPSNLPTIARSLPLLISLSLAGTALAAVPDSSWVRGAYRKGDFKLVHGGRAADVVVSTEDFKVVRIAAADLVSDVERVSGKKPHLRTDPRTDALALSGHIVLAGTLGKSSLIDALVRDHKVNVTRLRGQWESFIIVTVPRPLPGVEMALAIIGSDRRGTAFGIYELSQAIGVSPWNWWADVTPEHRRNLVVSAGLHRYGPPSVQYRGIFLNDEDWGLQPWAAKTYEPERGDIGPRTYARIFELLLRLKANTLWPAMHKSTRPFNQFAENKQVADDYAVVMGSSHAEPMLRNNVGEWTDDPKNFDYTRNPEGVRNYWSERVRENGRFENIYTVGMRGIHDSPIQGPKTQAERIKLLEKIFEVQRGMLAEHSAPDVTKIPQIFCPYKEVLADYRNGLKVPDDVTIVFPDDNFGYIRSFPNAAERQRAGGFGVYYHISYLGRPLSYLWLNTTPPALIWEEMSKAYDHGVRKFWMLNVGDIKPAEIGIEFFMQMAWDASRWRRDNLPNFLHEWARREFGPAHAVEIAKVMDEYYRLGFARKPEHLQWYLPGEPPRISDVSSVDYGDEAQVRLDAYDSLQKRADRLYKLMPAYRKDAFFQLVGYPVRGAALANRRFFMMEKTLVYAAQGRASTRAAAQGAQEAHAQMTAETDYYNERMLGGKWRHMMAIEMKKGEWPSMRMTLAKPPELSRMELADQASLGVAFEGRLEPMAADEHEALPVLSVFTRDTRFFDVFNRGRGGARWSARVSDKWLKLSQLEGDLSVDARVTVSIDWPRAPRRDGLTMGAVEITVGNETRVVSVPIFNPSSVRPERLTGFVESAGVVSIEAEHFTTKFERGGAGWQVIHGLGRTGNSVAIFPTTAASIEPDRIVNGSPVLEYRMQLFTPESVTVTCYLVPTQPLKAGSGLRYAIGVDDQPPQVVTVGPELEVGSPTWAQNVMNATTLGKSKHDITNAGPHTLKIYMVDAGVVLDKIVVDAGGLRPSYLGPRETRLSGNAARRKQNRKR